MATKTATKTTTPQADTAAVGAQNADGSAVAAVSAPAGFVPKVKSVLTLPLLKMKEGQPCYIRFTAPIFLGKAIAEELAKPEAERKPPPYMANVVDMTTGELVQIMLGKVLKGIIEENCENQTYVGRGFAIVQMETKRGRGGNNYHTYRVEEIEV